MHIVDFLGGWGVGVVLENLARISLKLLHFLGVFEACLAGVGGFDGFTGFSILVGFIDFLGLTFLRDFLVLNAKPECLISVTEVPILTNSCWLWLG